MRTVNKIDRPPAVENWSRFQQPSVEKTAKRLFAFLRGGPRWGYQVGKSVVRFNLEDGIDREQGLKIVERSGNKLGRVYNRELVDAYFDYMEENPIEGIPAFSDFKTVFPISRGVSIDIKPIAVVRDSGRFSPIFLCPWSSIGLDSFQSRILMTVLEQSVFRLSDFEDSNGKVLFFPKVEVEKGVFIRRPVIWSRGDKKLLTDKELNEQIKIFCESKVLAVNLYAEYLQRKSTA